MTVNRITKLLAIASLVLLAGCQSNETTLNQVELRQLTHQQIMTFNQQTCQRLDSQQIIVKTDDPLHTRLRRITTIFPQTVNGQTINYHIYRNIQPNAWSSLNGCIRINKGLFDVLNDNEIQAVIAHEIGHIALQHSIVAFQQAKSAKISHYGDITLLIPQSLTLQQELAADNYAIAFFSAHQLTLTDILSMLNKLTRYQKQDSTVHPNMQARQNNVLNQLALLQTSSIK